MRGASILLGLLGCVEVPPAITPPLHPCHADRSEVDATFARGTFGELEGGELWCGHPPQGGAPYSPLQIRLRGPEAWSEGMLLEMIAADPEDGSELAYTDLTAGLICANVGDNEGFWVSSEAHMRYDGWSLEELAGRSAELTVRASSMDGGELAESSWRVGLVLEQP